MILTFRNRKCFTYCLAVLVVTWIWLYTTLLQSRPLPDLNKEYSLSDPIINPYNFTFLINSERCDSDVQLLIVVHSSTKVSRSSTFSAFFLSLNSCGYWLDINLSQEQSGTVLYDMYTWPDNGSVLGTSPELSMSTTRVEPDLPLNSVSHCLYGFSSYEITGHHCKAPCKATPFL